MAIEGLITSTANPQIKSIRKLKDRKYRSESGLFFLEGLRIVIEALQQTKLVTQLILARDLLDNQKAVDEVAAAQLKGIPVLEVSAEVFRSISEKDGPQGLAAVGQQKWTDSSTLSNKFNGVWVALYQIADPGNLGTILRTLDGMGGSGVILLDHCTDPYDPSAIRASMGTVFNQGLIKMSTNEFVHWAKNHHIPLVGTSDAATVNYRSYAYSNNTVLVMGSEREGMPDDLKESCDVVVSIPMMGSADSLNLGVATSIVLYEMAHKLQMLERKGV